jgi:hypothetical protein
MPLYWLCYRQGQQTPLTAEQPCPHARMRVALADLLDQGEFTEGHELDRKWKVAKETIGRRLNGA